MRLAAISAFALAATVGGLEMTLTPVDEKNEEAKASAARAEAARRAQFQPEKEGSTRICSVEEAMERTGTKTPKEALDAVKKLRGARAVGYAPHVGAKQKAKAEKRRIAALKKSVGL